MGKPIDQQQTQAKQRITLKIGKSSKSRKNLIIYSHQIRITKMSYNRYGGGSSRNQGGIPSPWANQSNQPDNNLSMNVLGSMLSSGSGNMANLATSLVAQALQNKPGGMMISGNHFPQTGSAFNNSGSRGGGFMDRRGRDDYGRGRDNRDSRRPPFRRSRSRSRDRGQRGGDRGSRRNDSSSKRDGPPEKRTRAGSPANRAPFEVYIGNYPVRFREADVRNLFSECGVEVNTIRLKHDGHKVFAFAETTSDEQIAKAIKALDSKEIHGRRLRVRSSKDKDRKDKEASERKRPPKRELTEDDVTRHLVFAFNGFLDRQASKESIDEEKKKQIEDAKKALIESFDIPDDDSLKISRNLELIFLHNNRREIPVPQPAEEPKDENEEDAAEKDEDEKDENEKTEDETEAKDEENGEESKDQNGDEKLVEDETNAEEETEEKEEATEEADEEEMEEQEEAEEDAEAEDETKTTSSTPSTRGGPGRGGATARRSRGRRGGAP